MELSLAGMWQAGRRAILWHVWALMWSHLMERLWFGAHYLLLSGEMVFFQADHSRRFPRQACHRTKQRELREMRVRETGRPGAAGLRAGAPAGKKAIHFPERIPKHLEKLYPRVCGVASPVRTLAPTAGWARLRSGAARACRERLRAAAVAARRLSRSLMAFSSSE